MRSAPNRKSQHNRTAGPTGDFCLLWPRSSTAFVCREFCRARRRRACPALRRRRPATCESAGTPPGVVALGAARAASGDVSSNEGFVKVPTTPPPDKVPATSDVVPIVDSSRV